MYETFTVFLKKLLGKRWERAGRSFLYCGIGVTATYAVWGSIVIREEIFYLILLVFSADVMWKALSSEENRVDLRGVLMLPVPGSKAVRAFAAALAVYTVVTKTAFLLTVLLAVSDFEPWKLVNGLICAFQVCFCTAAGYWLLSKKRFPAAAVLAAGEGFFVLGAGKYSRMFLVLASMGVLAVLLGRADPCLLCRSRTGAAKRVGSLTGDGKKGNVLRYLFRYMASHGNYMVNTLALCGLGLMFSFFIPKMGGISMMPMGFALLSLNTPVSILLSSDRRLCRGIRMLPGQIGRFAVPYGIFIACNLLVPESVFFLSCAVQFPEVGMGEAFTALLFILHSALLLTALEWKFPLTKWKIESDLYHHPRKYCVPVIMLLCAVLVSTWPVMSYVMLGLLVGEAGWLAVKVRGERI